MALLGHVLDEQRSCAHLEHIQRDCCNQPHPVELDRLIRVLNPRIFRIFYYEYSCQLDRGKHSRMKTRNVQFVCNCRLTRYRVLSHPYFRNVNEVVEGLAFLRPFCSPYVEDYLAGEIGAHSDGVSA